MIFGGIYNNGFADYAACIISVKKKIPAAKNFI